LRERASSRTICSTRNSSTTSSARPAAWSSANGTRPGDGAKMVAVNVRCLDGVDLDALKPKKFDGRSL
jgi:hypothetical protein